MKTLLDLGSEYGSDKFTHGYLERYEPYLAPMRDQFVKVLEIGIAGGASLRMWRDYFAASRLIMGVDHNKDYCAGVAGEEGITPLCADATKPETWKQIKEGWGGDFDFICDDGFHTTANIIQSFKLGFPLVRPGGVYAIEDLHAVYLADYNRDNRLVGLDSTDNAVDYFKDIVDYVNESGAGQTGQQINSLNDIESIHFHKSLVIVRKR